MAICSIYEDSRVLSTTLRAKCGEVREMQEDDSWAPASHKEQEKCSKILFTSAGRRTEHKHILLG